MKEDKGAGIDVVKVLVEPEENDDGLLRDLCDVLRLLVPDGYGYHHALQQIRSFEQKWRRGTGNVQVRERPADPEPECPTKGGDR
jgi:hypothetical protein